MLTVVCYLFLEKKLKSDIEEYSVSIALSSEKVAAAKKPSKSKVQKKKKKPVAKGSLPKKLKKLGYVPKPPALKVEPRMVFHLHLPKSAYEKIQEAAYTCGLSMQEFVRRAAASAVFDMPA